MTHLMVLVQYKFLQITSISPNIKCKSDLACMQLKSSWKVTKGAQKDLENTLVFKSKDDVCTTTQSASCVSVEHTVY